MSRSLLSWLVSGALAVTATQTGLADVRRQLVDFGRSGDRARVVVGGVLDAGNTFSWRELDSGGAWAVETMRSITLRNRGAVTAINPRLAINGRGGAWSVEERSAELAAGAVSEQERAYRLWYGLAQGRYHFKAALPRRELADPFRQLKVYGYGLCGHAGATALAHFWAAGLRGADEASRPFLRLMHGHVQGEVFVDGRAQLLDVDERRFVLDRENERPVSGDELARDHDLFRRELADGPVHDGWRSVREKASRLGRDDRRQPFDPASVEPAPTLTLRPGEEIRFSWAPPSRGIGEDPPLAGSGRMLYRPLSAPSPLAAALEQRGLVEGEGELAVAADEAVVVVATTSPFTLTDGRLGLAFSDLPPEATIEVALSFNRKKWVSLSTWRGQDAGGEPAAGLTLDLPFAALRPRDQATRSTFVRLSIAGGRGARLTRLELEHELLVAPLGLPWLDVGDNQVEYRDDTGAAVAVEAEIEWREHAAPRPPAPPSAPLTPRPGETVASTFVPFQWTAAEGATAWHLQVARRQDFAWPYRPNYDVIVGEPRYEVPFRGMFSPGETYWWRLRARSADGVWSAWSAAWSFSWQGPRVPLAVAARPGEGWVELVWQPNPRGERPVAYQVWGSDERGFSIEGEHAAGQLLGTTAHTSLVVAAAFEPGPGEVLGQAANRAFYRVLAVDAAGVESAVSDFVELPRPWLTATPPSRARVGEPYQGRLRTLVSLGDLQQRPPQPDGRSRYDHWEREVPVYSLLGAPGWLRIEAATGELSGTPGPADVGVATFTALVRLEHPFDVSPDPVFDAPPPAGEALTARFELAIEVAP